MLSNFRVLHTDKTIRTALLALLFVGFSSAATLPYLSIIWVKQLGRPEEQYSWVIFGMALTSMLASLFFGYISDFAANQKRLIVLTLFIGTIGFSAFYLSPWVATFLFCLLVTRPNTLASFSLLFAAIRARSLALDPAKAVSVNSAARSLYSFSWIVVPGIVGAYVAASGNFIDSFAFAAGALLVGTLIYAVFGSSTVGTMAHSGNVAGFGEALRLIGSPRILLPVCALAMIACAQYLNQALVPLLVVDLKGASATDVGLLSGLVAFLEMPFMLLGAILARRFPIWRIVILGGVIHVFYLAALYFVDAPYQVFALAIPNAAGAAILFTMHLHYCQELMKNRPGLGTSLMSVVQLLSNGVSAAIFAAGESLGSHGDTALIGAGVVILGCIMIGALHLRQAAETGSRQI